MGGEVELPRCRVPPCEVRRSGMAFDFAVGAGYCGFFFPLEKAPSDPFSRISSSWRLCGSQELYLDSRDFAFLVLGLAKQPHPAVSI